MAIHDSINDASSAEPATVEAGRAAYAAKRDAYFSGAREDYVRLLPANSGAALLELGCGSGATGALALAEQKCSRYCGIEISAAAGARAQQRLTEVVIGDVETLAPPWPAHSFDALIMSEVLEHLADPWAVLRKLRSLMKPGAMVLASSPNVSHHSVVRKLLAGRWELEDEGIMDRTHLRWFTPDSYPQMFESCGYRIERVGTRQPLTRKARMAMALMGGWGRHLFIYQIDVTARV